jgi:hypothetical protein
MRPAAFPAAGDCWRRSCQGVQHLRSSTDASASASVRGVLIGWSSKVCRVHIDDEDIG